jgi:hypothetical protein
MALYSVKSERLFCDQLQWNLLWMWFLDREVEEGSWNHWVFAKNSGRVLSRKVAALFFPGCLRPEPGGGLGEQCSIQRGRDTHWSLGLDEELCAQGWG